VPLRYLILTGHGRSGTNWLLRVLDRSAETFCRSEVNEIEASPFASLPCPVARSTSEVPSAEAWSSAVEWASERFGERDQPIGVSKKYFHRISNAFGLYRLLRRRRLRRLLSVTDPRLARREWPMPFWLGRASAVREACPVLKMVLVPGWIVWALETRPEARVLHIVRHPGGFLNSWLRRYVEGKDRDAIRKANYDRLTLVANADPAWGERFGYIEALSLEESELWFWAYSTAVIHEAGENRENYFLVRYETLAADTLAASQRIYEWAGVTWSDEVRDRISSSTAADTSKSESWRERLSTEQASAVDRIVETAGLDVLLS